jgi:uncharacterized protein (DUF1501 family)
MSNWETQLTRRAVLQLGVSTATLMAVGLGWRRESFAAGNPHFMVTFVADGGWDPTQVLDVHDPNDPADGIDVDVPQAISGLPPSQIAVVSGLPYISNPTTRPAVDAFMTNWASRTAIVNGVGTRSTSHDQSRQLVLTGYLDPTRADFSVMSAHHNGAELPVPHLLLSGMSFGGAFSGISARVGGQLSTALAYNRVPDVVDPNVQRLAVSALGEAYIQQALARERQLAMPAALTDKSGIFADANRRGDKLAALASSLPQNANTGGQLATSLGTAFRAGMTASVTLSIVGGFDTHTDNTQQNARWDQLFTFLNAFVGGLAAQPGLMAPTLLDETTVIYCSEFGRTPRLNADNGKDHHPFTSMLLVGKRVRGGMSVGRTDGDQEGLKVNYTTGQPDDAGQVLDVQNMVAGIVTLAGANSKDYLPSVTPFTAMIA